jgi:Spy/CpxP family protein refolding chaperone
MTMWLKARPLLLVLSLALNGAFIASFASQALFAVSSKQEIGDSCCPLLRQGLGATEAEWQRLEPRLAEFRKSCRKLCRKIEGSRRELIELIAAADTKPQALRAKQDEILAGQRQMQELVVEHLLATKKFLTPQQQRVLFDLIRTHCVCDPNVMDCEEKCNSSREGSSVCCGS